MGFYFEKPQKIEKSTLRLSKQYQIDQSQMRNLKEGKDVVDAQGNSIANQKLTHDPRPPKSYAFCSDTAYHPEMIDQIHQVDVLYHEATFLNDHQELAQKTLHSTAQQAAQIAKDAHVKHLILGHYSSRYKDLTQFQSEAAEIFPHVDLAYDGYSLEF